MTDVSLQAVGFRVAALVLLVGLHGGLIAGAAVLLGDRGPKYDGRLSLVPTRHIDLVGAFCLIVFGLGWSKQVSVDPREIRYGRIGAVLVVLCGLVGVLAAAALFGALVRPALTQLSYTAGVTVAAFLQAAAGLAIGFGLLSLVPVPPLAGWLVAEAFGLRVPPRFLWISTAALAVAVGTGLAGRALAPAQALLSGLILTS